MATSSAQQHQPLTVWVLGCGIDESLLERVGDARRIADQLGSEVGALVVGIEAEEAESLVLHGVDTVSYIPHQLGQQSALATAAAVLSEYGARLVFAAGDARGRVWAARLAVQLGWRWVSPALMVQVRNGAFEVSGLDRTGRLSRKVQIAPPERLILTLRPGVGEALQPDLHRRGRCVEIQARSRPESVTLLKTLAADPADVDIRYAERLVAGGRGVGSKAGFEVLRHFADKIGAGVAASRMAVDQGWIEYERQVGQTGKTVAPELYLACGIRGASHHLEGMSGATHIVAINTDPDAPIFKLAHLGLVADLHEVLQRTEEGISER